MTEEDFFLLKMVYSQEISQDELIDCYPQFGRKDFIISSLKNIVEHKDNELFEYIMFFLFASENFHKEMCGVFQRLVVEEWHRWHEDIARILQFKINCPDSVDYLIEAIDKKFDYLFKQDDYHPFVRKCINAIASIKTDYAVEQLRNLSNRDDEYISNTATHLLQSLNR